MASMICKLNWNMLRAVTHRESLESAAKYLARAKVTQLTVREILTPQPAPQTGFKPNEQLST